MNTSILPYLLLGSSIGYFSWNFSLEMTALSTLIFFTYFFVENRTTLFMTFFSYRLSVSYGIVFGLVDNNATGYLLGFTLWVLTALFTSLPWVLLYSHSLRKRMLLFPLAVAMTIVPPIGFIDGADPIMSAGIFFPHSGYMGLVYYLLLIIGIASLLHKGLKKNVYRYIASLLVIVTAITMTSSSSVKTSQSLFSFQTFYDFEDDTKRKSQHRQKSLLKQVNRLSSHSILLPENILGQFHPQDHKLWRHLQPHKEIYAGAHRQDLNETCYQNVLLKLTKKGYENIYLQRLPVPVVMWKPYANGGACTHLFTNQVPRINHVKTGVFICYEIYIPYLYLMTLSENPSQLVGIANLWWSHTSTIERLQHHSLELWGRLFGIPSLLSLNKRK